MVGHNAVILAQGQQQIGEIYSTSGGMWKY